MFGRCLILLLATAVATLTDFKNAAAHPADEADGYRGIWYANQATGDEYRFKYSGGFATYPQQHVPIAIYNAAANKTFFCYGGSTGKPKELAGMVSYFDHATGQVPRPRVVIVKHTDDAHENPTISLDDAGHLWVFCNTHGPANNSYIFRSKAPYSIDEFEQVARTNFSYSQPWFVPGRGFFFLHTRYDQGRRFLHWMTSADGYAWSEPSLLAAVEMERYRQAPRPAAFLAKRFAAKEALGKALGLGLRDPATLHNIAVASDGIGRPRFEYAPPLADWMQARRLRAHLSLSDETDTAMAFVVVEQEDTP